MCKTKLKLINSINQKRIKGFQFNWAQIIDKADKVFGLIVNTKIVGLIGIIYEPRYITVLNVEISKKQRHKGYGSILIAFSSWVSLQIKGNDGYVFVKTKTNGVQHFYAKLGAYFIADNKCYFSKKQSQKLVDLYEPEGGFKIVR